MRAVAFEASGDVLINGAITNLAASNTLRQRRLNAASSSIAKTIKEPMRAGDFVNRVARVKPGDAFLSAAKTAEEFTVVPDPQPQP